MMILDPMRILDVADVTPVGDDDTDECSTQNRPKWSVAIDGIA